jgi:AcrR family transcriptional regulator
MDPKDSPRRHDDADSLEAERQRLLAAFTKVAAEHGYADLEIEQVCAYAGVTRETFEAHFETKEQGLVAAQDAFLRQLLLDVVAVCDTPVEWPLRVRAGLEAVISSLLEARGLARVFAVEAAANSIAAAERQRAIFDEFAALLREGRRHYPAAASLPDVTEQVVIAGVAAIVSGHLLLEDPLAIPTEEAQLVELLLMPYVGAAEARRFASA